MRVLVTGADGFVGSWLVPRLLEEGHQVMAGVRPGAPASPRLRPEIPRVPLELTDGDSVNAALGRSPDAVIHLAAVASGTEAGGNPAHAWTVNAVGTVRVAEALGRARLEGSGDPLLLVISTAEVYGPGDRRPRVETDPVNPVSPYAASKLGAEIAAFEVYRRTGLRVIVARAFPHSGRGQDDRFVLPAFAKRLLLAKRVGAPAIEVGNLDVVREFNHVSDVVDAYCRLLVSGKVGEVYNVASGVGVSLREVLDRMCELVGYRVVPETSPTLLRRVDIPYLVGNADKLKADTGWSPKVSLDAVLQEVLDAQED
ncbi:GDP-6-deoxy-D-mannose reductase [bacterium HR33]|nr:GDP-6-deoxy-D-mannose reductase [bacterium HR33]